MDYASLSLADVRIGLESVARDAQAAFGGLDARQLNWRPDPARWSVGQCFEHMLTVNKLVFQAADDALDSKSPRSIWQRLPILPRVFGTMLVRSQSPDGQRRFTAPSKGQPASSDIDANVLQRFLDQHRQAAIRLRSLDERDAARAAGCAALRDFLAYVIGRGHRLEAARVPKCVDVDRPEDIVTAEAFIRGGYRA